MRRAIRNVPDFPEPGILFRDVTPLLGDAELFRRTTDAIARAFASAGVTHVAGVESRGFIFGAPVAQALGAGFVPVRKAGKLPGLCRQVTYQLEYRSDCLEIQEDAVAPGSRVLVLDDVLATGGTAAATCQLIEGTGSTIVGCAFAVELAALEGRRRLHVDEILSLLIYE
jgi:adenine phosphoribosyltransferase